MSFRITSDIPALANPMPAGQDIYQFESKGFAPAPTSVETLRHIADGISGDMAFVMQGILRKAADELEAETARLDFLINEPAYVWRNYSWIVTQAGVEDPDNLTRDNDEYKTAREAIDAARAAK